ncbi:unnamed protein product [Polarella glacialis]|uniref:Uncharacterized protein n=1 Tax=Polarella glacialis TaxID=89957 RepID=A0A813IZJ3_POLGL|nr:unnamed protein product [Polarella glacialis]
MSGMLSWATQSGKRTAPTSASKDKPKRKVQAVADTAEGSIIRELAKLGLHLASHSRQHDASLQTTVIMDSTVAVCEAMSHAGKLYNDNRATAMPDRGSPHFYVWAALIQALLVDDKVPEPAKAVLKAYADSISSPKELGSTIWVCKMAKAFEKGKTRLTFSVHSSISQVFEAVLLAPVALGGDLKTGIPPRSPPERAVQKFLSSTGGD